MRFLRSAAAVVAAFAIQSASPCAAQPLPAPLAGVPAAFAAEQWDAAAAPLLALLEERATALPPEQRAAAALDVVSAFAVNRRFDDARRWAATVDGERRFFALAFIANTQAISGDTDAAHVTLREAIAAGAASRGLGRGEQLVATMARLGDGESALALAGTLGNYERAIGFARIAAIGPSGRVDGVPERALAALRDWTPGDLPPTPVAAALSFIARAQIRHGDGAGALARLARVPDPAWQAFVFIAAAAELANWQQPALSAEALRRAERQLGITAASDLAAAVPRMPPLARQWLGCAYLRTGHSERVAPAFAAYLAEAGSGEPAAQVTVLSRAAQMVGGARLEIAEAAARARSVPPQQAAAAPVQAPGPGPFAAVPAAFVARQFDGARAPLLAEIERLEGEVEATSPQGRAVMQLVIASFATSGRIAEAQRRAQAITHDTTRAWAFATIAAAQAILGDAAGARTSIAAALAAAPGNNGVPQEAGVAGSVAAVLARLGEDDRALAMAHATSGIQRGFALAAVASAGPTGRADGAPERAWAELRSWAPPRDTQADLVALALNTMVHVRIRYGEGATVLDRIATIPDRAWRTRAMLQAAGDLAAARYPELAERALRDAEVALAAADLDPAHAALPGTPVERMRRIAQPWLAYAYARRDDPRAGPALAATLDLAMHLDQGMAQIVGYATIVGMISTTQQYIAEATARPAR